MFDFKLSIYIAFAICNESFYNGCRYISLNGWWIVKEILIKINPFVISV